MMPSKCLKIIFSVHTRCQKTRGPSPLWTLLFLKSNLIRVVGHLASFVSVFARLFILQLPICCMSNCFFKEAPTPALVLVLLSKNCVMPLRKNPLPLPGSPQPPTSLYCEDIEPLMAPAGGMGGFCARLSSNRFLRFVESRRDANMTRPPWTNRQKHGQHKDGNSPQIINTISLVGIRIPLFVLQSGNVHCYSRKEPKTA